MVKPFVARVPLTVSLVSPLKEAMLRVLNMVTVAPTLIVTLEMNCSPLIEPEAANTTVVPPVSVADPALLSQLPLRVIVLVLPTREPFARIVSDPVMMLFVPVLSVVVPEPAVRLIVRSLVVEMFRGFVFIVYVIPVPPAAWSNVTLPRNSVPPPQVPQNCIGELTIELNVIGAAKDHEAEVLTFVHAAWTLTDIVETVHDPPAVEEMKLLAAPFHIAVVITVEVLATMPEAGPPFSVMP
jgi:hypothetical protein